MPATATMSVIDELSRPRLGRDMLYLPCVHGLRLSLSRGNDVDGRPAVTAVLRADDTMVAFAKALLRDCRPGDVEFSTEAPDASVWIGNTSFELADLAAARRAARWLQQAERA